MEEHVEPWSRYILLYLLRGRTTAFVKNVLFGSKHMHFWVVDIHKLSQRINER